MSRSSVRATIEDRIRDVAAGRMRHLRQFTRALRDAADEEGLTSVNIDKIEQNFDNEMEARIQHAADKAADNYDRNRRKQKKMKKRRRVADDTLLSNAISIAIQIVESKRRVRRKYDDGDD